MGTSLKTPSTLDRGSAVIGLLPYVFFFFFFGVVLGLKPDEGSRTGGVLFGLIGVGFLVPVVRGLIRRQKFGRSYFEIKNAPVSLGGVLDGTLKLGRKMPQSGRFTLRLVNYGPGTTIVGGKSSSTALSSVLWDASKYATAENGLTVPVQFVVPEDALETTAKRSFGSLTTDMWYFWRLEVTADVPGVDYAAKFEIPVVRAISPQDSPAEVAIEQKEEVPDEAPEEIIEPDEKPDSMIPDLANFQLPAHSAIKVQNTIEGKEFYFPPLRNRGLAFPMLAFLIIFSLASGILINYGVPMLLMAALGVVNLLLLALTGQQFFGTTRVVVDHNGITVTKHLASLHWSKAIAAKDIVEIHAANAPTMNLGSNTTGYFNIQIVCRDGRKITAGAEVPEIHEAHWLALEMARCAGLHSSSK